jgi:ABC-type branched-subunit amino acid transport system ATPase component
MPAVVTRPISHVDSSTETILSLETVSVRYGGHVAVDGVTFDITEGSITALIGPNGAGKTTLMDAISGFQASSGAIVLAGQRVDDLRPHDRARVGLGRTFQSLDLYDKLTVAENVLSGAGARLGRHQRQEVFERTMSNLGLNGWYDRLAENLSHGQRQLVSVGRALMSEPKVLLLDEPAAGLDISASVWLAEKLRAVQATGVTIVLVDHNMNFVMELCENIHVLNFGQIIASGPPDVIVADPDVTTAYLGDIGFEAVAEVEAAVHDADRVNR